MPRRHSQALARGTPTAARNGSWALNIDLTIISREAHYLTGEKD